MSNTHVEEHQARNAAPGLLEDVEEDMLGMLLVHLSP